MHIEIELEIEVEWFIWEEDGLYCEDWEEALLGCDDGLETTGCVWGLAGEEWKGRKHGTI